MPSLVAASITVAPASTSTGRPSISSLMVIVQFPRLVPRPLVGCHLVEVRVRRAVTPRLHGAALVLDVVLELLPVHLHEGARGHRRGIPERADGAPLDVIGEVEQQFEVLAPPGSMLDAIEDA